MTNSFRASSCWDHRKVIWAHPNFGSSRGATHSLRGGTQSETCTATVLVTGYSLFRPQSVSQPVGRGSCRGFGYLSVFAQGRRKFNPTCGRARAQYRPAEAVKNLLKKDRWDPSRRRCSAPLHKKRRRALPMGGGTGLVPKEQPRVGVQNMPCDRVPSTSCGIPK